MSKGGRDAVNLAAVARCSPERLCIMRGKASPRRSPSKICFGDTRCPSEFPRPSSRLSAKARNDAADDADFSGHHLTDDSAPVLPISSSSRHRKIPNRHCKIGGRDSVPNAPAIALNRRRFRRISSLRFREVRRQIGVIRALSGEAKSLILNNKLCGGPSRNRTSCDAFVI